MGCAGSRLPEAAAYHAPRRLTARRVTLLLAMWLRVWPSVGLAPQDLRITFHFDPQADDRVIQVSLEGPEFARSSAWSIEGTASPHVYSWWWRAVPAGSYVVKARVSDGQRVRARIQTRVFIAGA